MRAVGVGARKGLDCCPPLREHNVALVVRDAQVTGLLIGVCCCRASVRRGRQGDGRRGIPRVDRNDLHRPEKADRRVDQRNGRPCP
jgi:hypothetical protein